jgi:hypothetical protein
MKMCTPMLAGAPPPKFPGNQPIKDESRISKWINDMKYYTEYLIDLCVPWSDESFPSFERSAKGFCLLIHAWSSKSLTFIERQRYCFLSKFMSKGHQSSHNKTAATAWCQRNAGWWSEMKTAKHDTSLFAKAMDKATNLDDEAAGQLSSTDLYHITMAALEDHVKQCLAYHALSNNYTSLMYSSNLTPRIHEATPPSPVFMQHNILDNAKLSKTITSLKDMRTAIHKLLPKDLENPIKENITSTSGDQGPNEGPIEDHSGTTLVSCTCDVYLELLDIFHTAFSVEQFECLVYQI